MKKVMAMFTAVMTLLTMITYTTVSAETVNATALALKEKQAQAELLGVSREAAVKLPEFILDNLILDGRKVLDIGVSESPMEYDPRLRGFTQDIKMYVIIREDSRTSSTENWFEIESCAYWGETDPFWQFKDIIATAWNCDFAVAEDSCANYPLTGT